jgi:hypothetical protein
MSACGTLGTVMNYILMTLLIVVSIVNLSDSLPVNDWRFYGSRIALVLGLFWVVLSIMQLVTT